MQMLHNDKIVSYAIESDSIIIINGTAYSVDFENDSYNVALNGKIIDIGDHNSIEGIVSSILNIM